MGLFVLILVGGMVFFLWEYTTRADQWIGAVGSPHLYNNGNLGYGTVTGHFSPPRSSSHSPFKHCHSALRRRGLG